MSSLEEMYADNRDADLTQAAWWPVVSAVFPVLAQSLKGGDDWKRNTRQMPPMTCMIRIKDGQLRCTLSSTERPRMIHCSIENPADILWSVEKALREGKIEFSDRQENGDRRGR